MTAVVKGKCVGNDSRVLRGRLRNDGLYCKEKKRHGAVSDLDSKILCFCRWNCAVYNAESIHTVVCLQSYGPF